MVGTITRLLPTDHSDVITYTIMKLSSKILFKWQISKLRGLQLFRSIVQSELNMFLRYTIDVSMRVHTHSHTQFKKKSKNWL